VGGGGFVFSLEELLNMSGSQSVFQPLRYVVPLLSQPLEDFSPTAEFRAPTAATLASCVVWRRCDSPRVAVGLLDNGKFVGVFLDERLAPLQHAPTAAVQTRRPRNSIKNQFKSTRQRPSDIQINSPTAERLVGIRRCVGELHLN
jgi:hypothetical protein